MDSLLALLKTGREDTNKVNTLLEICKQNGMIDDSKKEIYSEEALELSAKLNYRKGMIVARMALGNCLNNLGNFDKALKYSNEALKLALEDPDDKRTLADVYNIIGINYYYRGDYTKALPNFLKSSGLYEAVGKKGRMANVEYNMSLIYWEIKEYEKAIEYTKKAIAVHKQMNEQVMMANEISQLGNIYTSIKKYDTALYYFKESLQLTEKIADKSYAYISLSGIGNVLQQTEKYPEALAYYKRLLETAKELDDKRALASALINTGYVYSYLGDFKESVSLLKQAIDLSVKIGDKRTAKNAYGMLSRVLERKSDFREALSYQRLYTALADSIFSQDNATQINDLSAQYESEKKKKEIRLLNAELLNKQKDEELLHVKVKEKNSIIIGIGAGTLLLAVSGWLLFSRRQLRQKNAHQLEISRQQELTAIAIIRAQENERNRIAQDLHDGIGTFLSTLKLNLQGMEDFVPSGKAAQYKTTTQLVDKTSAELRNILKNLSSETLQESGLTGALQELIENVNRLGPARFNFVSHGITGRLDGIVEINLYRVAQELINNCIKHARATQATLQLIDHEHSILFMMEDNGKGFDPQHTGKDMHYGMGLKNILSRVTFIKGTLKTESVPGKGSTFIIEIPKQA